VIVEYAELVAQALETPFEGWDFGVFGGRFTEVEDALPWATGIWCGNGCRR
jgi:hypothetical protein